MLLLAVPFLVLGVGALLIEALFLVFGQISGFPWVWCTLFGVAFVSGAWTLFHFWRTTERQRVICSAAGFRLETASRRRVSRTANYRWDEVAATACKVEEHEQDDRTVYYQTFHITTADGGNIRFDDSFRGFVEVIGTFNAMTPHLPYVWTPRPRGQEKECDPGSPDRTRPVDRHAAWMCVPRPAKV